MKRCAILLAGAAALALSACGGADESADDIAVVETETPVPTPPPAATETAGAADVDGTDRVTVGPDGVQADINDGDMSVQADIDEDPSVTVRD